jgi:hypothetical protein
VAREHHRASARPGRVARSSRRRPRSRAVRAMRPRPSRHALRSAAAPRQPAMMRHVQSGHRQQVYDAGVRNNAERIPASSVRVSAQSAAPARAPRHSERCVDRASCLARATCRASEGGREHGKASRAARQSALPHGPHRPANGSRATPATASRPTTSTVARTWQPTVTDAGHTRCRGPGIPRSIDRLRTRRAHPTPASRYRLTFATVCPRSSRAVVARRTPPAPNSARAPSRASRRTGGWSRQASVATIKADNETPPNPKRTSGGVVAMNAGGDERQAVLLLSAGSERHVVFGAVTRIPG